MTPMARIFSGLVVVGLVLGGVWLSYIGLGQLMLAHASKTWPSVTGTIVSAGVKTAGTGQNYSRKVFVQYRYTVEGSNHSNDRMVFSPTPNFKVDGTIASARDTAIKELATRPGGSEITVYYDPEDPRNAVLLPGGTWFFLLYVFGSVLMFAFAFMVFPMSSGRTNIPIYRR